MHKHKANAKSTRIVGYRATIDDPTKADPRRADGGICIVEACSCGAVRRTNSNGKHEASTGWVTP